MKKIVSLLIISVITLSLVGCGSSANSASNQSTNNTSSTSNLNDVNTAKPKTEEPKKEEIKKEYIPSAQGEFGHIYKSEKYKNLDGSYAVINVKNILIEDNDIVVQIGAPTQDIMQYALNKFISFNALDKYGDSVDISDIKLQSGNGDDISCEFVLSGVNLNNAQWVEIGPYKLQNQTPTYKITK